MLSRGKVTPATVGYYTTEVARGLEDYYAGRGEAEGVWLGAGSAAAGLRGAVSEEQLARLFEGSHPLSGDPLGAPYRVRAGADRVTGWDLTFSAPKSVSVLWAVGGAEIGMEVRDAHDAAVLTAVGYLEEHAAFSRTGKAGVRQVDTDGLVAAGFVHRQSRAGDPQLHTHVLVSGRVRCSDDGQWRALDSRALHRQLKPAGMLYQAALRAELTGRLGVEWTDVSAHGQAEIVGVPDGLRERFSQRRSAAEARVAELSEARQLELGRLLTVAERRMVWQHAVLATRSAKTHDGNDVGLHDRWLGEATLAGCAPEGWLGESLDRSPGSSPVQVSGIVEELETGASTWSRADVVRAVACHTPATIGDANAARVWVERTTDEVLATRGVLRLAAPGPGVPVELVRRDGQSVFDRHDAARYSTTRTLQLEKHVLDTADASRGAGRGVTDIENTAVAVRSGKLSADQAMAVEVLTQSGDAVACLVGPAGAGKSHTMAAAGAAWRASGVAVRGVAVSAVAAGVLHQHAGIPSDTIAKLLHSGEPLRPGEVLVVDEAGMVPTRDLARLLNLTEQAGGKLVLVGDPNQLGPIDAGGLFPLLCDSHAAELDTIHRFTEAWEADATLRLRAQDPTVLDVYDQQHRVHDTDRTSAAAAAADCWLAARAAGESCVITAADNDTVTQICETVRARRVTAGAVEADGVFCDGQTVAVGDEIVTLRNDRTLRTSSGAWVRNGDRWTVTGCDDHCTLTVSSLHGRGALQLPPAYTSEQVHLAYALTVHKAQGVTVDRSVTVVDETTSREHLYVGMTRGRDANHALVITESPDDEHHDPPNTPRQVLVGVLARSSSDRAATLELRDTLTATESLATLIPKRIAVDEQIARHLPPDPTPRLQELTVRRAHLEAQLRPGVLTSRGRNDTRRLRDLDQQEATLQRKIEHKADWLDYRDQLVDQITERRHALGVAAVERQPEHLTQRLGHIPDHDAGRDSWTARATSIEAYRDQWGMNPDDLDAVPRDSTQRQQWELDVELPTRAHRYETHDLEHVPVRELDTGIGLEL